MTISARNKIQFPTNPLFSDVGFRNKLEHHIDILRDRATVIEAPSLLDQDVNKNDFRMVLKKYGIPSHMHWLIMRINNIIDCENWDYLKDGLRLIDESDSVLSGLITLHYTNKK